MRRLVVHRSFLNSLLKRSSLINEINKANLSELTTLSEIARNLSVIAFTGAEKREVLKSLKTVKELGRASKVGKARDLAIILARKGVLQILIKASLALSDNVV